MLANLPSNTAQSGSLSRGVHKSATFRSELLTFITSELPCWRDHLDRPLMMREATLTNQLCLYLNSAARRSLGWDILQFITEPEDEHQQSRRIDLAATPSDGIIWIEGRRHTIYDILFPIECKRLPTPKDKKRDEREYVFSDQSSTGGIQRFKAGYHGGSHTFAAMIAYVQDETLRYWINRVEEWISALAQSSEPGWTENDSLRLVNDDQSQRVAVLESRHTRNNSLPDLKLHHLWLQMW